MLKTFKTYVRIHESIHKISKVVINFCKFLI